MSARDAYLHFQRIGTRWKDNDQYGHVNNIDYYSFFDTVINAFLIRAGGFAPVGGSVLGFCAESHCRFLQALSFPDDVDAGLRVSKLGRSSVRYEIGLFAEGRDEPAAEGWFVHVFVDRKDRKPCDLPDALRAALSGLLISDEAKQA